MPEKNLLCCLLFYISIITANIGHANTISGTVTSSNGPEAGVWVIAETGEEGGQGNNALAVNFQLRPDPLGQCL